MEAERKKPEDRVLCLWTHGDFSFSMLVIHTDLFTQVKVLDLFNVHSLEVMTLIVVMVIFD